MPKILIFRTDRIGDLLATCPAILTIKKHFGDVNIKLVASSNNFSYANKLKIFDEVYNFPSRSLFSKVFFIYKLKREKFDYIFIFDGKERSFLSSIFIKSKFKTGLSEINRFYYKLFKIKTFQDKLNYDLYEVFKKMLTHCNITTKINNFNFLIRKKDNNFSARIPINKYTHIHLDEKWFTNLYINSYTEINPNKDDFIEFLNTLAKKDDVLITTGLIDTNLVSELKDKYFSKIDDKIYTKKVENKSIYLIYKPTFDEIESLLRNSKTLIACHGAITHASNSFNVKKIDIIEKSKHSFYKRFNSYLNNYHLTYRTRFTELKNEICNKI